MSRGHGAEYGETPCVIAPVSFLVLFSLYPQSYHSGVSIGTRADTRINTLQRWFWRFLCPSLPWLFTSYHYEGECPSIENPGYLKWFQCFQLVVTTTSTFYHLVLKKRLKPQNASTHLMYIIYGIFYRLHRLSSFSSGSSYSMLRIIWTFYMFWVYTDFHYYGSVRTLWFVWILSF